MFKKIIPLTLTITILVTAISFASSAPVSLFDPISLIDRAHAEGRIDLNDKARLVISAIKAPETLPAEYRTEAVEQGGMLGRSATMAIVDIKSHWDELDPTVQTEFSIALGRPSGGLMYTSGSGYFLLHYNTSGGDAVSTIDNDGNGTPDYIEKIAAYCDSSLWVHQALNYRMPPSDGINGGDSLFDVYFEEMPYYGYAVPEDAGPEPWNDATSYLVMHRDFIGFPPNTDPEGNVAGAAKATAAHEFHHCVQFAYDYGDEGWFMEMDATYMEDIVFDHVNDNYNYLPPYLADPESALMEATSTGYYRFIWGIFLAARYDTSLMVAAWEGGRYTTATQAIADTLAGDYGTNLDAAFVEYTEWNYFTGVRDDGTHYAEASSYPALSVALTYNSYPIPETLCPDPVDGYAASYIVFNSAGNTGTLHLEFKGAVVREWYAYVIKIPLVGTYSVEAIPLDANYDGVLSIPNFEEYDRVILVGANIQEYSGSSSFYYSAQLSNPFYFTTEILSDTNTYPGELKYFDYRVTNQSGQGEVIDIFFDDAGGWTLPVSQNHYVSDGTSVTARLPMNASPLVPLGEQSMVNFRVQLRDDPLSGTDDSLLATAVPKRGDVDYDNKVNLADITALISYVYLDGTAPIPLFTGDFDCDDKYNLSDITSVISYVYLNGSKSPCDSYEQY